MCSDSVPFLFSGGMLLGGQELLSIPSHMTRRIFHHCLELEATHGLMTLYA
jgi:hypothetical protein